MTRVPYRAAIIGTGRIGSRLERDALRRKPHTHAGWYHACPRTRLVGGCDTDPERLRAFGRDWGLPAETLFADYRQMLDRLRPEIVSICAYAPERRAMAEAAVESGARGLWVEKAIACSVLDAEAIADLARRRGVAVIVDQPRRGDPRYLGARRLIQSGQWGALQSIHCLMSGHLIHTGVHAWDVLDLWLGEWTSVAGWLDADESPAAADAARQGSDGRGAAADSMPGAATAPGGGPDDQTYFRDRGGHVHVIYESGVHVFVSAAVKRYFIFQFDLLFEAGRLRLGNDVDEATQPAPSPRYTGFVELAPAGTVPTAQAPRAMLDSLVEALDGGPAPWMSIEHAVAALRLGIGVFQSHHESHRCVGRGEVRRDLRVDSV